MGVQFWRQPYAPGGGGKIHSAKPEAFLDLVEQLSPGPRLELFARRQRLGWDTWGNEALEHVAIDAAQPVPPHPAGDTTPALAGTTEE
jgi:hypothetical protein